MTPDFSTRGQRAAVRARDVLALVLGAALLAWGLLAAWQTTRAAEQAQGALREMRQRTSAAEQRSRALSEYRPSPAEELAARAVLTVVAPPARVLADLEASLPAAVRLNGVTLNYGETLTLEITAVARNPEAYDRFLERLEASPHFTDLSFGTEARKDDMQATVRARYRSEGAR